MRPARAPIGIRESPETVVRTSLLGNHSGDLYPGRFPADDVTFISR